MKKFLQIAALCALVGAAAAAPAQSFENGSVVGQVPDRVVVTFREGVQPEAAKAAAGATGIAAVDDLVRRFEVRGVEALYEGMTTKLRERIRMARAEGKSAVDFDPGVLDRTYAFDFPADMGLQNVLAAFKALPEVQEVRAVDICRNYAYLPNDPGLNGDQWYLRNMDTGGKDVRAVGGWNQVLGDSNVVVAIVDSGVDWRHPDLGGTHPDKVNGAIWTNWEEYYGNPGQDDDGNGKIDDIRGWDFVNVPGDGWPDEDDSVADNDPSDYESHGTNCAGIVAGIAGNGIGVAGVAHGCKVMAVRVGWLPDGSSQGVVRMDFASQGMVYAANNGADVVNASWGSTSFLSFAVSACQSAGVLIVTAAGNDNTDSDGGLGVPSYLSTVSGALAVAATDQSDAKASFSNFGSWVEISAPGVAMYTTAYNATTQSSTYASVQGTSFSSPLTAGAAALVWSANPGLSYTALGNLLRNTADDIDDINPSYANQLGSGRVNLLRALGDNRHLYPDEFPTLFDVMNTAAAGDSVLVAGGFSITEPVIVSGEIVAFYGGYDATFTSRDALGNPTIIQGSATSSAMRFRAGVGLSTVIDGFTITGGGGLQFAGIPYTARYGGGIMLNAVSPTLRNITVTGNGVGSSSTLGCGGGIAMNNSSAVLENVTITGNAGVLGAGLFAYRGAPTLIGCTIDANSPITDNLGTAARGGGVHVLDANLTMENCTVTGHAGLVDGGGVYAAGVGTVSTVSMSGGEISGNEASGKGCGFYQAGGTADVAGALVSGNVKPASATFTNGGGLYFNNVTVTADSLTVEGNDAHNGGGVMFDACPSAALSNSVIAGNGAFFFGGGVSVQTTPTSITGCTIVGNAGTLSGGGGIYGSGSALDLANTIVADNTGGASFAGGVALSGGSATFACNDAWNNSGANYSGVADPTGTNGNISADPQFCSAAEGNYSVAAGSPCHPDNSGGCGLIGALNDGCGGASDVPGGDGAVPAAFRVDQAFPNPFNPKTTIRFALPEANRTVVQIFDVKGRLVRTLLDGNLPASTHELTWTGRDDDDRQVAAGVYFYMVTSGDHHAVGRMALVK